MLYLSKKSFGWVFFFLFLVAFLGIAFSAPMVVSISSTPTPDSFVGQTVTWTGTIGGGKPPFDVTFTEVIGGRGNIVKTETDTLNISIPSQRIYATHGLVKMTFSVTDFNGFTASRELFLNVLPAVTAKCADFGGTCEDIDMCVAANGKEPVNWISLCPPTEVCCVLLPTEENSIISLKGVFQEPNTIVLTHYCKTATANNSTITLTWDNHSITNNNIVCGANPSSTTINDDDPLNPFPIGSIVSASLKIEEPCEVCTKTITLLLTKPTTDTGVPDNSIITLLALVAIISFIVSRKGIKTNYRK